MPSLSFKRQFIPAIKAGLAIRAQGRDPFPGEACKLQTIRARGKRAFKIGDTLYLGVGMRTSSYERIGTAICREVLQIQICPSARGVSLEHRDATHSYFLPLTDDAIAELAAADGFSSIGAFFDFFTTQYGPGSFCGQLIKW